MEGAGLGPGAAPGAGHHLGPHPRHARHHHPVSRQQLPRRVVVRGDGALADQLRVEHLRHEDVGALLEVPPRPHLQLRAALAHQLDPLPEAVVRDDARGALGHGAELLAGGDGVRAEAGGHHAEQPRAGADVEDVHGLPGLAPQPHRGREPLVVEPVPLRVVQHVCEGRPGELLLVVVVRGHQLPLVGARGVVDRLHHHSAPATGSLLLICHSTVVTSTHGPTPSNHCLTFTAAEDGPVLADAGVVRHAAGGHHDGQLQTPEGGHTQPGHQGEAAARALKCAVTTTTSLLQIVDTVYSEDWGGRNQFSAAAQGAGGPGQVPARAPELLSCSWKQIPAEFQRWMYPIHHTAGTHGPPCWWCGGGGPAAAAAR